MDETLAIERCADGSERVEIRSDTGEALAHLRAAGFAEEDLARAGARVLLEANRIPERLRRDPDGRVRLEGWERGTWSEFDFDPPRSGLPPMVFHFPQALGRRARELVADRPSRGPQTSCLGTARPLAKIDYGHKALRIQRLRR